MCVVLDSITQGSSMQMRQPVNERGAENGENKPRLFQMPDCCCDDCRGHHGAGDDAFAVDHSQRVALTLYIRCTMATFGLHFLAKSTQAPIPRQGIVLCPPSGDVSRSSQSANGPWATSAKRSSNAAPAATRVSTTAT